jgi:hypothetical protein
MKTFKQYLSEDKKTWMKDGVEMCSEDCCGQPVTECTCGPECKHCDCYEKNQMNEGKYGKKKKYNEAVGDPAAPLYDLIDEVGSHQLVLDELVRFLDVDQIEEFVADFRRHHDMNQTEEQFEVTPEEVDILKRLAGL